MRAFIGLRVEKNQIEIGRIAQLLAAKLAIADDREGRCIGALVLHPHPACGKRRAKHHIGERREMIGEPFHGEPAVQILREQTESLRVLEMAQHVHLPLSIARLLGHLRIELAPPRLPIRLLEQGTTVEQLIKQDRMAREIVRGPGARACELRKPRQHGRVLRQQSKIDTSTTDRFEQRQQSIEDGARLRRAIVRFRCRAQQSRYQCIEALS